MCCASATAKSATSASAPTATTSTSRSPAASPTTSTIRTSSRSSATRCFDEVDVVVIGGGFGGLLAGARLKEAGIDRRPHRREGRRLRRHVVLEPLPGRAVRHRVVHLPAAARGARLHPQGEVHAGAGDPRAQPAHRRALRALRRRPVPDRGDDPDVGRRRRHGGSSPPTAATSCAPASSAWPAGRCTGRSCPASTASSSYQGHSFHTSRGTTTTRAATTEGGLDKLARQAHRRHRHRCDGRADRSPPRRGRRAAVRVPAHAVVDRRARQPPDRPGVGDVVGAGLAEAADGELQQPRHRHPRARGPRQRRLDRHHRQAARADARGGRRRHVAGRAGERRSSSPTSTRWSRSGRASTRSSTTRTRPSR